MNATSTLQQDYAQPARAKRRLRILFAVHTPWTETLGVPRVAIELARHLEMLGHRCEKFSLEDSGIQPTKLNSPFTIARFQRRLLKHIRENGHRYHVIQAEHQLLPFPRHAYRYEGLLIAKSNALKHLQRAWQREHEPRLQRQIGNAGTPWGKLRKAVAYWLRGGLAGVNTALQGADEIHVLNSTERDYVAEELGLRERCRIVPNGLSEARASELRQVAELPRNPHPTVAFVGSWCPRKGRAEFPEIFRQLRIRLPQARLRLLGTGHSIAEVKREFAQEDRDHLDVVPHFQADELPSLLCGSWAGVFPSYFEGFGLGVLEMLAAGLPVVAWDIPGPRDLVRSVGWLVEPGNSEQTAASLHTLLMNSPSKAQETVERCLQRADSYRWSAITAEVEAGLLARLDNRRR